MIKLKIGSPKEWSVFVVNCLLCFARETRRRGYHYHPWDSDTTLFTHLLTGRHTQRSVLIALQCRHDKLQSCRLASALMSWMKCGRWSLNDRVLVGRRRESESLSSHASVEGGDVRVITVKDVMRMRRLTLDPVGTGHLRKWTFTVSVIVSWAIGGR